MTTSKGKPLSQEQLDAIRPDHGDTLVIHQHSDSFNMGWLLVNGRYLSNQEVEHLEEKADKFEQIKTAMGWLADPSADIILMEIGTYRQAAKNYKEKKDAAESALREAQDSIKAVLTIIEPYCKACHLEGETCSSDQCWFGEVKDALAKYCTKADVTKRKDGKEGCGYSDGASPPCSRCEIDDCSVFRRSKRAEGETPK